MLDYGGTVCDRLLCFPGAEVERIGNVLTLAERTTAGGAYRSSLGKDEPACQAFRRFHPEGAPE